MATSRTDDSSPMIVGHNHSIRREEIYHSPNIPYLSPNGHPDGYLPWPMEMAWDNGVGGGKHEREDPPSNKWVLRTRPPRH
jgi:hypothetical protein